MPRKPRLEYPGAVYHVLNRGNYRQDLFILEGVGSSFEQTLFETCERFSWQFYAYVLMSNHFHRCIRSKENKKTFLEDLDEGRLGEESQGKAAGYATERAVAILEKGLRRLGKSSPELQTDRKLWRSLGTANSKA